MTVIHKIVYFAARPFIALWFLVTGSYTWKRCRPISRNYIVLTNHNTNWDFLLATVAFRRQMYFVASEHIFRKGLPSTLLKTFLDPIPRRKGSDGIDTVKNILKRLRNGQNVCMMAEGNRSFNGVTGQVLPATAKLVRKSGAGLITFRIHGGYFVNPRWSAKTRKGPMWGETVREYTPEELAQMSDEDVLRCINADLYVNAYDDQKDKNYEYTCDAPAENLQTALFICPECRSLARMNSRGDRFFCEDCGAEFIFTSKGYFETADTDRKKKPRFRTITEWSFWQRDVLREKLETFRDSPDREIFHTEKACLFSVKQLEGETKLEEGRLAMFCDRIELGSRKFMLTDISAFAITLINTVLFTCGKQYYQITMPENMSALQYLEAFEILKKGI